MQNQPLFLKYLHGRHWDNHPTAYAQRFLEILGDFNGLVVDVGCGSGRDTAFLHNSGLDVIGIDKSEEEIAAASLRYPGVKFQVGDAEALAFANHSVGALYMVNVIHYVDQGRALAEALRVLRPSGMFLIHFNLQIVDNRNGNVDYRQNETEIQGLIQAFEIYHREKFQRIDREPFEHTHDILELVLQKRLD